MSLVLVRDQRQHVDQQLQAELQTQGADLKAARVETAKLKTNQNQLERQLAELRQQLKEAHTEIGTHYKSSIIEPLIAGCKRICLNHYL